MYYILLNYWRKPSAISEALLFFLIVALLFGLCQLHQSFSLWLNLNFLWLNLMFSILFGINNLFKQDKLNGVIDTILLYSKTTLLIYIYKRITSHFIAKILPVLLAYIPIGLLLGVSFNVLSFSLIIFTIASIGLLYLASISVSLYLDNFSTNFLQFIIILPLSVPLWLFAFGAIESFMQHQFNLVTIAFLIALSTLFVIIAPIFCCFILLYLND